MVYDQFLNKYNSTVFDDIPRKELTKYLDIPLTRIIERFTEKLNESELYALFDELEIKTNHPALITKEQKNIDVDQLSTALKDKKNADRFYGKVWEYETVKDNLVSQINDTLNLIKK